MKEKIELKPSLKETEIYDKSIKAIDLLLKKPCVEAEQFAVLIKEGAYVEWYESRYFPIGTPKWYEIVNLRLFEFKEWIKNKLGHLPVIKKFKKL
jgi:hypothetical protein